MIKKLILLMIIGVLTISTYGAISQANAQTQPFTDVSDTHWATKFIIKMKSREVIDGYTDQSFRPNQGIDQAQAVSMVIRFLGFEDEAIAFRDMEISEDNELYSYVQNVPNWARGYVLVAARLGIISNVSASGFNPAEEASRAWMAKLLVATIQKHGSITTSRTSLMFTDSEQIPAWARNEVDTATKLNIITGYTDGSFRPERTVTRAEMTALLSKAEEFIDAAYLKNVVRGTIEVKQADSLIINVDSNKLEKVLTTNNSAVLYQGDKRINFAQVKTTDEVVLVVNDQNEIIFLDLLNTNERKSNEILGKIYLNDTARELLTIEDDSKALHSYKFSKDTVIVKNNTVINLGDLNIYDRVKVTVEENEIIRIELLEAYEDRVGGEIVSINSSEMIVTVRLKDNTFEVISFKGKINIFDQQGESVDFGLLAIGDIITVIYQDENVASIEVPVSYLHDYTMTNFRSGKITLTKNGIQKEYEFVPNVKIKIPGFVEATTGDLMQGDRLKATIVEDKVVELEVLNVERKIYLLDNVDTSARALRVSDMKQNQILYLMYDRNSLLYRDYRLLDDFSQINRNDRIVVTLRDGQVTRVDIAVQQYYTVSEIDLNNRTLRLKDTNNRTSLFNYTDQIIMRINNVNSNMNNFSVNDRVSIYKIGNEILEINK